MSRAAVGWAWVAGQALLLGALIFVPGRSDWSQPLLVTIPASVLFFGGFVVVAVAALRLGSALTPTPVPNDRGALSTSGLYRFVRHPIYTGVLAVVVALVLRSGSWLHLIVGLITVVFFDRKAAWEERRLVERYPDYPEYARRTPKFVPLPVSGSH